MKKLNYMGMGLLLCLFAAIWTGCDKPNEQDDNGGTSGGGTTEAVRGGIEGVVRDKETGGLIAMATVELLPTGKKTRTDEDGAFTFSDLESGAYRLRISKEGYLAYTSVVITVTSGQTVSRSISLEKERAEMQILDMSGNALSELYLEWAFKGSFALKNSGNVVVVWEITEMTEAWLECSATSGELAPGTSERINLTIDRSKLLSEESEAVLNVVSEAGTMQLKVRVSMMPEAVAEALEELSASMVYVEGGTFKMGGNEEQESEPEQAPYYRYIRDNEKPVHEVTLDGFYIGKYEVTQGQWKAVMGTTIKQQRDKADPQENLYGVGDAYPMYYVSWYDAVAFCEKLSTLTGKKYRLPTEAEWEYSARGGQQADVRMFPGGCAGWYGRDLSSHNGSVLIGPALDGTHPVGQMQPNGLGLYDMSGNVGEWCLDWYDQSYYSSSPSVNPQGPSSGSARVNRGGGWGYYAQNCRVSSRLSSSPDSRDGHLGFRVVCER